VVKEFETAELHWQKLAKLLPLKHFWVLLIDCNSSSWAWPALTVSQDI
jgi:hypothetical protein